MIPSCGQRENNLFEPYSGSRLKVDSHKLQQRRQMLLLPVSFIVKSLMYSTQECKGLTEHAPHASTLS